MHVLVCIEGTLACRVRRAKFPPIFPLFSHPNLGMMVYILGGLSMGLLFVCSHFRHQYVSSTQCCASQAVHGRPCAFVLRVLGLEEGVMFWGQSIWIDGRHIDLDAGRAPGERSLICSNVRQFVSHAPISSQMELAVQSVQSVNWDLSCRRGPRFWVRACYLPRCSHHQPSARAAPSRLPVLWHASHSAIASPCTSEGALPPKRCGAPATG